MPPKTSKSPRPTTGDLFEHYGVASRETPPPGDLELPAMRQAFECGECQWLRLSREEPCPACGATKP